MKLIFFPVHFKATNEPVTPRDAVDPLFRPVNFLVPFTPQQGEITGEINTISEENTRMLLFLCH